MVLAATRPVRCTHNIYQLKYYVSSYTRSLICTRLNTRLDC